MEGKQESVDVERVDVGDRQRLAGGVGPLGCAPGKLEPPQLHVAAQRHAEGKFPASRVGLEKEQPLRRGEVGGRYVLRPRDARQPGSHSLIHECLNPRLLRRILVGQRLLEILRLIDLLLRGFSPFIAPSLAAAHHRGSCEKQCQPPHRAWAQTETVHGITHLHNRVRLCRFCRFS